MAGKIGRHIKRVKKDLESQGFVVRDGIKYGLDLLAYTDSPQLVHSKYGIVCGRQTLEQLIAYQRICNSNNKTLLIASVGADGVEYFECRRFITRGARQLKSN